MNNKIILYILIGSLVFILGYNVYINLFNVNLINTNLKIKENSMDNKIKVFIDEFGMTLLNVYNIDIEGTNLDNEKKIFIVKSYILQNKLKFLDKIYKDIENREYMVYNDFINICNTIFKDVYLNKDEYIFLENIDFLKVYSNYYEIKDIVKINDNIYKANIKYYNSFDNNNYDFEVNYYFEYIDNNIYLIKYYINS